MYPGFNLEVLKIQLGFQVGTELNKAWNLDLVYSVSQIRRIQGGSRIFVLGYYIALPDSIRVVKSPSEVLPAAWQAVQPDIFAEDSFLVVR